MESPSPFAAPVTAMWRPRRSKRVASGRMSVLVEIWFTEWLLSLGAGR